jgi:hypothetical protein
MRLLAGAFVRIRQPPWWYRSTVSNALVMAKD